MRATRKFVTSSSWLHIPPGGSPVAASGHRLHHEPSMETLFAFICDSANESGGKINVLGLGWETIHAIVATR